MSAHRTSATFAPAGEPEPSKAREPAPRPSPRRMLRPLPHGSSRSDEGHHVPRPGQVFGLVDVKPGTRGGSEQPVAAAVSAFAGCSFLAVQSSFLASPTRRGFPGRAPVPDATSFPHTAAGQRRNWPVKAAPASLLIPSLYLHKEMETMARPRYAHAPSPVKGLAQKIDKHCSFGSRSPRAGGGCASRRTAHARRRAGIAGRRRSQREGLGERVACGGKRAADAGTGTHA